MDDEHVLRLFAFLLAQARVSDLLNYHQWLIVREELESEGT